MRADHRRLETAAHGAALGQTARQGALTLPGPSQAFRRACAARFQPTPFSSTYPLPSEREHATDGKGQHREVAIFPSSARLAGSSVAFLPPRRCGGRHAPAREAAGPPSPGTQHNRQWSGDDGQVPVSVRLPIPAMDDPWCCSSSWWVALDLTSPRASDHQGVVTFRSRSELCNRCRSRRSAIHSGASPSDVAAQ